MKIVPHPCWNDYHQDHKQQQVLVRMWVGVQISTTSVENSMETPHNVKNRTAI
jgi:hypothetical protein